MTSWRARSRRRVASVPGSIFRYEAVAPEDHGRRRPRRREAPLTGLLYVVGFAFAGITFVCLAEGRPVMAVSKDARNRAVKGLGTGPADVTQLASDQPGNRPGALVAAQPRDLVEPIVVPNTLWQSVEPAAYAGGRASEITHL